MSTATLSPRTWATVQGLFAQRYQHAVAKVAQLVRTNRLPLNHALTMAHLFGEALAEHGEKLIPDELEHLAAQVTAARRKARSPQQPLALSIVDALFTNGAGEKATRLVLQLEDGRDGGGWSRMGAEDQISCVLRADLAVAAKAAGGSLYRTDYEQHYAGCRECREHPQALCAEGAAILLREGGLPA